MNIANIDYIHLQHRNPSQRLRFVRLHLNQCLVGHVHLYVFLLDA